jgi:4-amino-4-deoxy-L-arabinose transferase-like glycosyltransferase
LVARPEGAAGGAEPQPWLALAATGIAALALRLGWGLLVAGDSHAAPGYDGAWYDRVARDLLAGAGVRGVDGRPTAFFPPGYPALLAAAYAGFGVHPAVPKCLNAVLATLGCLLTYAVGREAYGWRVGLVAAALLALCPGDVFYAGVTLSEPAFACAQTGLVLAFLVWTRRDAPPLRWLAFGALLGAASLVRGIALLFPVVPLAAWLAAGRPARQTALRFGLVALGTALAVAPWTLRNQLRLGHPILIASDGPNALLIGHSPLADGSQSLAVWEFRVREYAHLAALENPRKEVEYARADLRTALAWMLAHPREELALVPKRLFHTFKHDHYALPLTTRTEVDAATGARRTQLRSAKSLLGLARLADAYFFGLVLFAAVGATRVFSRAARPALAVPTSVLFFLVAHGIVFWGDVRFHAPFLPMLAVLAAVAVDGRVRPWALQRGSGSGGAPS